ncbi:MAG: SpvB/TcaC N-terminal domain-containing protein [Pseudomonadota bacterium]
MPASHEKSIGLCGLAATLLLFPFLSFAQLNVNPQTGSLRTSQSIIVPAWYGVEPTISLVYSGGGNGRVGVGWSLHAASDIVRTSKHGVLPTLTPSDIYAVDGEELVPCSGIPPWSTVGSTHCLKQDNSVRVKQQVGTNWEVTRPNGIKLTYVPLVKVEGSGGTVVRWGLSRTEDLFGHSTNYTYACDDGTNGYQVSTLPCVDPYDVYLDSVLYGAGNFKVQFTYDSGNRPDPPSFAMVGKLGQTRFRLQAVAVQMKLAGQTTFQQERKYTLSYRISRNTNQSLLEAVQRTGRP